MTNDYCEGPKTRRTQASYAQIAADYAAVWQERGVPETQLERFIPLLPSGGKVLDVGCGPGFDTAVFRQRHFTAFGLDRSLEMLQAGRPYHRLPPVFLQGDMRALPLAAANLDGLWVMASLLHLPRQEAPAVLAEFSRVLTSGGILYLSVKKGAGAAWTETSYGHSAPRWYTYWLPETLDPLLVAAGFTIIAGWTDQGKRDLWLVRQARKG